MAGWVGSGWVWGGMERPFAFGIDVEKHDCHGLFGGLTHPQKRGYLEWGPRLSKSSFPGSGWLLLATFQGCRCILRVSNQISGKRVPSPEAFGGLQGYPDPPAQEV